MTAAPGSTSCCVLLRKQAGWPQKLFWVLGLLIGVVGVVMYGEEVMCMLNQLQLLDQPLSLVDHQQPMIMMINNNSNGDAAAGNKKKLAPFAITINEEELKGCDVFSGKWVWDNSSSSSSSSKWPLYEERECPFLPAQVTCQEHGRPDRDYLFWRWQPHACSLPRFDARKMLEALRGKRMMFVGDSLNRGQFESMICILNTVIPPNASSFHINGSLSVFTAKEYNATVEFYWAPFLLESNSDNPYLHKVALADRVVRKGSINKNGIHWRGVDIMVFNTYLWWMTGLTMKILRSGSFEDEVQDIIQVPTEEAYRLAMRSMVRWIQKNMDLNTSRVFFVTMSPSHQKSQDWGAEAGGNCYNQSSMISDANYWGSDCRKSIMKVIEQVFIKSSHQVPITLLNITQLSSYRKDAHTSIYKKQWIKPTKEQLANPPTYADCVHWCLPGLQDVWNELLFTKLFYPS